MGSQLIVLLLSATLISIPILAWVILRKISAADRAQKQREELHSLENSLSLMIKEIQESVQKALADMNNAATKLDQMIEAADDRIRQLQYYYEYGDELKPIVEPQKKDEPAQPSTSSTQSQSLRHKEVHELSRKGWSVAQIARHAGMSADEVQLIINLMEINTIGGQAPPQQPRQSMM
ncbi:MAG: hypothetical protein QME63_08310 [Actinomycetota bacterium]|nr:hypothetical protein [Actinomycetota bacterium]